MRHDAVGTAQKHAIDIITTKTVNSLIAVDILMLSYRNEGHTEETSEEEFNARFNIKLSAQEIRSSYNRCIKIWAEDKGNVIYAISVGAVICNKVQLRTMLRWAPWSAGSRAKFRHSIDFERILDQAAAELEITPHRVGEHRLTFNKHT